MYIIRHKNNAEALISGTNRLAQNYLNIKEQYEHIK